MFVLTKETNTELTLHMKKELILRKESITQQLMLIVQVFALLKKKFQQVGHDVTIQIHTCYA